MTPKPVAVDADAHLIPTIITILERRIDCLPVSHDGVLSGLIPKTDLLLLQRLLRIFTQADVCERMALAAESEQSGVSRANLDVCVNGSNSGKPLL